MGFPRFEGGRRAGVATTFVLLGAIALLIVAGPGTAEAKKSKPKVSVELADVAQGEVVSSGEIEVSVKSKAGHKRQVRVALIGHQGDQTPRLAPRKEMTLKPGKTVSVSLPLNDRGAAAVQSCIETDVLARVGLQHKKKWHNEAETSRRSTAIPPSATGRRRSASTVDTADRCDPITPAAHATACSPTRTTTSRGPTRRTDTGLRLNLSRQSTPVNNGGTTSTRPRSTRATASAPGRRSSRTCPGHGHAGGLRAERIVPITAMGEVLRRRAADRPHRRRHRPAPADLGRARLERDLPGGDRPADPLGARTCSTATATSSRCATSRPPTATMIPAPTGFRLYRDEIPTGHPGDREPRATTSSDDLRARSSRRGIKRSDLYMAWDFTVASTRNITERMLSIRDDALAQLGDTDLDDGVVDGARARLHDHRRQDGNFPATPHRPARQPRGREHPRGHRHRQGALLHPTPTARPRPRASSTPAPTGCRASEPRRNRSTTPASPATSRGRPSPTAAPGVFDVDHAGPHVDVRARPLRRLHRGPHRRRAQARQRPRRASPARPTSSACPRTTSSRSAIPALQDLSKFTPLPDRLQQGFLNFIYLGRLLAHPTGFAADPAFQFGGNSVLATRARRSSTTATARAGSPAAR